MSGAEAEPQTVAADDDGMTLEQREAWLKERGVLIENPGDRAKQQGLPSVLEQLTHLDLNNNNSSGNDDGSRIPFVMVPHDDSKPLQTLYLPASIASDTPGDALPNYVKPYFAAERSTIDATLLQEQARKNFAGGDSELLAQQKISPEAMNAVAAQGSVETFPLVHPADTNGYHGVYIYLDEVGMLKKLPQNRRASNLAQACGYSPAPNFYGDVFVGRAQSKPILRTVGFTKEDTSPSAEWMQRATSENLAWQHAMNQVTGKQGQLQPNMVGTEGNAAVEDDFEWTQDEDEIEIVVAASKEQDGFDKMAVKVSFLPKSIHIRHTLSSLDLKLPLYGSIDVDGSTWTLSDGAKKLVVTCEKANAGEMWPRIKT